MMDSATRFLGIWRRHRNLILLSVGFALLLATRTSHLFGPIDEPHSWRQCDTAYYAYAFYQDGINLLRPSVCWMGSHKTLILEFPLPELLMALAYRLFGYHLFLARLVTLAFFAGSALYLFLIVRHLAGMRLAAISAGVYIMLPLSQFYSRAIHIDFAAVFLAHAMTFHLLLTFHHPRIRDIVLAIIAGILAFLVKAPYAFYFGLPLLFIAAQRNAMRSLLLLGICLFMAALSFLAWRSYVDVTNAGAPDWWFIPGYGKFVNMEGYYYGPLSMRLDPDVWRTLLRRFRHDVTSNVGAVLCLVGFIVSVVAARRRRWQQVLALWAWSIGVLGYVTIFLNLNYHHDYYQIPFLAVSAVFIALTIDAPIQLLGQRLPRLATSLSLALFVLLSVACLLYARQNYFVQDHIREEAGRLITQNTPVGALIIAASDMPGTDCRDPRLLFRATRIGWSIYRRDLSITLIHQLKKLGATHLAILTRTTDTTAEASGCALAVHQLRDKDWKLVIAELIQRD